MRTPLALTVGEPAGIGPDIALAAWVRRAEFDLPPFYLLADPAFAPKPRELYEKENVRTVLSVPMLRAVLACWQDMLA